MKFRLEYSGNINIIIVHVDQKLTVNFVDTYKSETWNEALQPDYVKNLWKIPGVEEIFVYKHQVNIIKGEMFEFTEEMIKEMVLCILNYLEPVLGKAEEIAPPMRWFQDRATKEWYKTRPKKSPKKLRVYTIITVAERKKKKGGPSNNPDQGSPPPLPPPSK